MEACAEMPPERRFIRLYIDVMKGQLYISVQNATPVRKRQPGGTFSTTKAGVQGFGLARVDRIVALCEVYVKRQSEEVVFATEITARGVTVGRKSPVLRKIPKGRAGVVGWGEVSAWNQKLTRAFLEISPSCSASCGRSTAADRHDPRGIGLSVAIPFFGHWLPKLALELVSQGADAGKSAR
jgi:hypothetical protein